MSSRSSDSEHSLSTGRSSSTVSAAFRQYRWAETPPPVDLRDDFVCHLPTCTGTCCAWQWAPNSIDSTDLVNEIDDESFVGESGEHISLTRSSKLDLGEATPIPRFLFRGYNGRSGGGDPRLNQVDRIFPHAFIDGHAPSLKTLGAARERADFQALVVAHLEGDIAIASPFSSWTQSVSQAVMFSTSYMYPGEYPTSRLAVIDTTLLPPRTEALSVFALREDGVHPYHYPWEYLLYGPIYGDCLYTVPSSSVNALLSPPRALNLYRLASHHVVAARAVGRVFCAPQWARAGEGADVVIYATIIVICEWLTLIDNRIDMPEASEALEALAWRFEDVNDHITIFEVLRKEFFDRYQRAMQGEEVIPLVNGRPFDTCCNMMWFQQALELMFLLQGLEGELS